jgi:xanthine/uracil/vitamin C permease (AzgA family)
MIWPGALVNAALFNTFHKRGHATSNRHISRERFFLIALACSFFWYWVPGYLFTGLSVFNWVCWIAPNNLPLNALFGTSTGLGMSILTFDWSQISFIGNPLVTPVCFFSLVSSKFLLSFLLPVVGSNEHGPGVHLLLLDHRPHSLL